MRTWFGFAAWDRDGDGSLTREELRRARERWGDELPGGTAPAEELP